VTFIISAYGGVGVAGSGATDCVQVTPVKVSMMAFWPSDPTATHEVTDVHDTEFSPTKSASAPGVTGIVVGVQVVPDNTSTRRAFAPTGY
jgi:hypothetical protein